MRKLFSFSLLTLAIISLCACSNKVDPNEVTKITIKGDLNKKHYAYNDKWDLNGLKIFSITRSGEEKELTPMEYILTTSVETPAELGTSLLIGAKFKKKPTIKFAKTFKDISVDIQPYNKEEEISNYYADCDLTKTGSNLLSELHRHSFVKHTKYIKYNQISSYVQKSGTRDSTDLIPNESKMENFYTGKKTSYGGTREHVWPCSHSSGLWPHSLIDDNDSYFGGGSDLYHIRPTDYYVNGARSNSTFVCFDDSEHSSKKKNTTLVGDDGPYYLRCYGGGLDQGHYMNSDLVEVDDHMKGDVARILSYIYMHYKNLSGTPSTYSKIVGNLQLSYVLGYGTEAKCKAKLIEWNKLDPVSEVEIYRNHTVQSIQGNRNPFVDDPTLVSKCFG